MKNIIIILVALVALASCRNEELRPANLYRVEVHYEQLSEVPVTYIYATSRDAVDQALLDSPNQFYDTDYAVKEFSIELMNPINGVFFYKEVEVVPAP